MNIQLFGLVYPGRLGDTKFHAGEWLFITFWSGLIRDGPLENLWGGGRSTKKIFAQGKIEWKKIHAHQLTLKNIHATA